MNILKKILVWVSGSILVLVFGSYIFIFRPIHKEELIAKPIVVGSANLFISCLEGSVPDDCLSKYTDDKFKNAQSPGQFAGFVNKVKTSLGPMLSSELDEKSFSISSTVGTEGKIKIIRFSLRLIYQNDPNVRQNFVFVKSSGEYKIQSWNVNSVRLTSN